MKNKKRKGFTLAELVLAMAIFAWIMLIFSTMVSFNFRFTRMTIETDSLVKDYLAKNTIVTRLVKESSTRVMTNTNELTLDSHELKIESDELVLDDSEVLYELKPGSTITMDGNQVIFDLEINNELDQSVELVIN